MYSSKYLDFLEWSKVYNHRMLGTHLTIEGAKECLASKNSMNSSSIKKKFKKNFIPYYRYNKKNSFQF
jgi:hypothetical protein